MSTMLTLTAVYWWCRWSGIQLLWTRLPLVLQSFWNNLRF